MKRSRMTSPAAALLALSLLSGCSLGRGVYSNYRPLETLQLAEALGVDRAEDGGVVLSAAVAKGKDDSGGGMLRSRAAGLVQGLEALQDRAVRGQVFYAHTQAIVLGQAYAEDGVGALLDYVERDVHTRMGTDLFVVRDGAAEALLTGSGEGWDAGGVLRSVRSETQRRGDSHVYSLRETAVDLSEYGAARVCALRLVAAETGDAAASPGLSAVPEGFGVLKDGKLVAFLDGGEARAAGLLRGTLGAVPVELPDGSGGAVTLVVRCAAPDLSFTVRADGPLRLTVRAAPEAVIAAAAGGGPVTAPEALDALTDALNAILTADIEAVLARSKALDADFLALQRALRLQGADPARLPPDWLRDLTVSVEVDARILRSSDMGERAGMDGGGG